MALVDLKSKLNQFRGENTPNNPYQKSGKRDTDLESNVDINTNPDRKQLSDTVSDENRNNIPISSGLDTLLKGLKKFGILDVPIESKYENTIKTDAIFYGRPFLNQLNNINKGFQSIKKSVKNFSDDPFKSISDLSNIDQEQKLREYRSKAYGKFRNYGNQGKDIISRGSEHRKVSRAFEGPVKGDKGTSNVNRTNMTRYGTTEPEKTEGLIPFRFKDVLNDKLIVFDAILSGITDTISPEYSSERYIGRPESVYVYQGVQRSVGFTFDVYPMTRQELPVIWEKLNYLVGLCYPNWVDSPYAGVQVADINPITMVSPICELTIGDMYNGTPGYLSSLTMTVQDGTTWEFEENLKLPHYIQVTVEFVYIGKYLPNAKGKHFELNWLVDSGDKMGTYIAGTDDVYDGDDAGTISDSNIGYVNRIKKYDWINPTLKRNQAKAEIQAEQNFNTYAGLDISDNE